MKKSLKITLTVAVAALLGVVASQNAQAIPITGGISMAGAYTPQVAGPVTQPNLTLATQIAFGPTFVTSANGDFGVCALGTLVTMTSPLIFAPLTVPMLPLWAVDCPVGGPNPDFSFDLLTLSVFSQNSISLELRGTGMMNGVGFTSTPGPWVATFNTLGGTFSWSSSNSVVPDGGLTIALLGFALVGVQGLRRKLQA